MSEQKQNNAEIDLYYFFKPIGTALKKGGNLLAYAFRKIDANKISFIIVVLLITLAGYSLRYIIKPSYQTEVIFVSIILPGKYCSILLKNLNKIKGENNSILARQLKINNEAAADIQSIGMSNMRDTFLIDRRDSTLSLFKITLTLKSTHHLDTIQWGLVNYLENNDYAIKRKEAKRTALQALKENLNRKLESLDSLKKIVNSSIIPRSEGKGIILGQPIDPVSVYQAEINYFREQLNIDQALATIDNIEIIQPFLELDHTNYPRYNRLLMWYFLGSLVVASLTVLLFGRKPKY
jgi:hypothetical protein